MRAAALAIAAVIMMMNIQHSRADTTYPWCAQYGEPGGARNCGFATYGQCRAALSGNGGYCEENPTYRPTASAAPASRKPRH